MTTRAIFDADGNFTAIGRAARANETLRTIRADQVVGDARPGNGYWNARERKIIPGAQPPAIVAPTAAEVRAHTQQVVDRANVTWIWEADGSLTENDRWKDFFHWVGSAHLAVTAAVNRAQLTAEQKLWLFLAYQNLVPVDYSLLATWYRAHNQPVWTGYRAPLGVGDDATVARGYFGATIPSTPDLNSLPSFASDANSAPSWFDEAGASPSVLDVRVPLNWRKP